jgi:hypothetical protein
MPNFKTFNDEKNIYSVDMMMAYVNTHKLPIQKINIEENLWQIEQPVWGTHAPVDVLKRPRSKEIHRKCSTNKKSRFSPTRFL